jgi:hypothetical protein
MGMECMVSAIKPSDVQRILDDPDGIESILEPGSRSEMVISLEKAWHGLHYLLTGSAHDGEFPLGFILQGGQEFGEDDGYGQPRLFNPSEVAQIDQALAAISDDQLWRRFDAEQMSEQGVYPDIWDEDDPDLREEYLHYFNELKSIVNRAAQKKCGLVVMLT